MRSFWDLKGYQLFWETNLSFDTYRDTVHAVHHTQDKSLTASGSSSFPCFKNPPLKKKEGIQHKQQQYELSKPFSNKQGIELWSYLLFFSFFFFFFFFKYPTKKQLQKNKCWEHKPLPAFCIWVGTDCFCTSLATFLPGNYHVIFMAGYLDKCLSCYLVSCWMD